MRNMMIKLSIVIPVYNEIATIEEIVKRVKNVSLEMEKEIIIVDDASSDGTKEMIEELGDGIKKVFHDKNQGKGAAIRTALRHATGDIIVIQDADLEYHPSDYQQLIEPILEEKADAVFGSRFIGAHRCFLFTHYLGNKIINLIANILYNTTLTDLMTCYKAFNAVAIKDISIKANRFGFEAEITATAVRKGLRIYEVPISYSGRNYAEGKKITWKDFFPVIWWLLYMRFSPLKDKDAVQDSLDKLSSVCNYNKYIYDKIKPNLGRRVLEIGAGTGNITRFLMQNRELLIAVDKDGDRLSCLSQKIPDSSVFKAFCYDMEKESSLELKRYEFDSAVCINVLEHISDDRKFLGGIGKILKSGGRLILLIPAYKGLFCKFDKSVGHYRRYDKKEIERLLQECDFHVKRIEHFNFLGLFAWWFNFKVLKKRGFSNIQLLIFDHFVWLVKLLDCIFKNTGISLIAVADKEVTV